jgi:hypothetical protein
MKFTKASRLKQIEEKIVLNLTLTGDVFTVTKSTKGLYNQKCFVNAVDYAMRHKKCEVHQVITVDADKVPILHYIVYNTKKKHYIETTLGHVCTHMLYFKQKIIPKSEWPVITSSFSDDLTRWNAKYLNWFDIVFLDINRVI